MRTRALQGILGNYLGAYLSRDSDYHGYWLFGFLVHELTEMRVNLLQPSADDRDHFRFAIELAVRRFHEQLQKGRVQLDRVRAAELTLKREPTAVLTTVNGTATTGWVVRGSVVVEVLSGRQFTAERRILVTRHNPTLEYRRSPEDWLVRPT